MPTWRPDSDREVDLIEEIARIHGYDNIARTLPERPFGGAGLTPYQRGPPPARELMAGAGPTRRGRAPSCPRPTSTGPGWTARPAVEAGEPARPVAGPVAHLPAARPAPGRPLQPGAPGRRPQPVRDRQRVPPGPAGRPAGLVEGVLEWEQLGLVAVGDGVDAAYAVRAWQVLAEGPGGRPGRGALARPGPTRRGDSASARPADAATPPERRPGRVPAPRPAGRRRRRGPVIGVVGELAPEWPSVTT